MNSDYKRLNEDPDTVNLRNKTLSSSDNDSVTFVVLESGELIVTTKTALSHMDLRVDRADKIQKEKSPGEDIFKKSGRLWYDEEVISFWWKPSEEEIDKLIPKLEQKVSKFHQSIDITKDWVLDIPEGDDGVMSNYFQTTVGEYTGSGESFSSLEDPKKRHQKSPGEKSKGKDYYDYGKALGKKDVEKKRQKQKKGTTKFGHSIDDYEPSKKIKRFREIIREIIREIVSNEA